MNNVKAEKYALEGIEKIDRCVKNIIKNAYDLPPNLDNKIANKLLGKYAYTEKIIYNTEVRFFGKMASIFRVSIIVDNPV